MLRKGAAGLLRPFSAGAEASLKPSGIVEIRETTLRPRDLPGYLAEAAGAGGPPGAADPGLLGHFVSRTGGGPGRVTSFYLWEDHAQR